MGTDYPYNAPADAIPIKFRSLLARADLLRPDITAEPFFFSPLVMHTLLVVVLSLLPRTHCSGGEARGSLGMADNMKTSLCPTLGGSLALLLDFIFLHSHALGPGLPKADPPHALTSKLYYPSIVTTLHVVPYNIVTTQLCFVFR